MKEDRLGDAFMISLTFLAASFGVFLLIAGWKLARGTL